MLTYAGKALGNWSAMWIFSELMRHACGSTAGSLTPAHDNICNSQHEPIGVRGFLRGWGRFLKMLGLRERTKEEKHI